MMGRVRTITNIAAKHQALKDITDDMKDLLSSNTKNYNEMRTLISRDKIGIRQIIRDVDGNHIDASTPCNPSVTNENDYLVRSSYLDTKETRYLNRLLFEEMLKNNN